MPLRWNGKPDPSDPRYQDLSRRLDFAVHLALYAAINSGLWFVQLLRHPWQHLAWLNLGWLCLLALHLTMVWRMRARQDAS